MNLFLFFNGSNWHCHLVTRLDGLSDDAYELYTRFGGLEPVVARLYKRNQDEKWPMARITKLLPDFLSGVDIYIDNSVKLEELKRFVEAYPFSFNISMQTATS